MQGEKRRNKLTQFPLRAAPHELDSEIWTTEQSELVEHPFPKPQLLRAAWVTLTCLLFTLFAGLMAGREMFSILFERVAQSAWLSSAGHLLFMLIVACLIYGGVVYQLTRLVHIRRQLNHRRTPRENVESLFDEQAPQLTILVPSYKEETSVVMQTLLSAALQDYPSRRVVLLIDDPPNPSTGADAARLRSARALPRQVRALLEPQSRYFTAQYQRFLTRKASTTLDIHTEVKCLIRYFDRASNWFSEQAKALDPRDHAEQVFLDKVLVAQRERLRARAQALRTATPSVLQIEQAYRRLASLFRVEVSSFERKRYVNLSHEANKAMNLNSYIGLLGKQCRERVTANGLYLEVADVGAADFEVPDADYLITLDADSLLVPDYALRLVHLAEQPVNERLAVVQTPYSAFPGAPGALERIAGATTDIQYNIHQGFCGLDGTYWVGANALLRKSALTDIAVEVEERGFPVKVFIQDRTVIEDTESTVDLLARGWQLLNYPERLAYSATPPDFGSLIIQRSRWANGGLIILPKLLTYLAQGKRSLRTLAEAFVRIHYLASIAAVNFGLVIILAVPFTDSIRSWWLPLAAVPYFALYARDLQLSGYRGADLIRVYALNLLLIPVNLGGVLKSLQQGWTGQKIPFGRTPKVKGRTVAAPLYILAEYYLMAHWLTQAGFDFANGSYFHGLFVAVNTGLLFYAIAVFVGFRASGEDLRVALARRSEQPAVLVGPTETNTAYSGPERRWAIRQYLGPERRIQMRPRATRAGSRVESTALHQQA